MTSLIAAEQLLCCVCDSIIEIGSPVVYCDDQPVHESCEWDYFEDAA